MAHAMLTHSNWQAQRLLFALVIGDDHRHDPEMKITLLSFLMAGTLTLTTSATTITVVPVFEPLSLHDTDGDEAVSDTGDALQACVMARPMAMTGAFPEALVDAIRSPHRFPTNNENYKVPETNLLVLANIEISAIHQQAKLVVTLDVSKMTIPKVVDLTSRQIINLTIVAIRKTLEMYQVGQDQPLPVALNVKGTTELNASLKELNTEFLISQNPLP
jgi:hypothetical protein